MRTIKNGLALMVPLFAAGCMPVVEKDPPIAQSAAVIAQFAPDSLDPCSSVLPFPTDLSKNPETGKLDGLPFCVTDSAATIGLKKGLRTLDGYSLNTAIYTHFSAAVDTNTLADNVLLFDENFAPVPVEATWVGDEQRLYITPTGGPLASASRFSVVIKDGLKAEEGGDIVSDRAFVLLKSREPLIDGLGYSRWSTLDDATAFGLEALRLGWAPLFTGLEAGDIARENVLVAWSFTTQRVGGTLRDLHGLITADPARFIPEGRIKAADHELLKAKPEIPKEFLCDIFYGRVELNSQLTAKGLIGGEVTQVTSDYMFITPADFEPPATITCPAQWTGQKIVVFSHGLGRCKNDVLALANGLAKAGFAVLTVDGPRVGRRALSSLGDQDFDGCPDQPDTPELIAVGGANPNPFSVRDHMQQWAFEISQVASRAKEMPEEVTGVDLETDVTIAQLGLLGHSWGGGAAVIAGALNDDIDVIAVTAASGDLAGAFSPLLEEGIALQLSAAGVDITSAAGQAVLAQELATAVAGYRWALESGDPLYAAGEYPSKDEPPVLVQVVANLGVQVPLHFKTTQESLLEPFSRVLNTTFTLACKDGSDDSVPLCDYTVDYADPYCSLFTSEAACVAGDRCLWETDDCGRPDYSSVVGSMLQPCSAARAVPAGDKTQNMQTQMVTWLATNGACAGSKNGDDCDEIADTQMDCQ